jgi:hypothetical protein
VENYPQQVDAFLQRVPPLAQIIGGQPACGTDIISL